MDRSCFLSLQPRCTTGQSPARAVRRPWLQALVLAVALAGGAAHADEYSDVNTLLRSGKMAEALAKAEQYLVGKPRDPQMRFLRAVIQADAGKTADAIAGLLQLVEDFPEIPEPYNNLAVLYAGEGQYERARGALEMAIRLNPNYATAHENLGDVYARLAGQAYSKSLQLEPANTAPAAKLRMLRELYNARLPARPAAAAPKAPAKGAAPAR
ncbi:MAG: tetratricopeptide repeat protein [Burkholderiaceae bacterium]